MTENAGFDERSSWKRNIYSLTKKGGYLAPSKKKEEGF